MRNLSNTSQTFKPGKNPGLRTTLAIRLCKSLRNLVSVSESRLSIAKPISKQCATLQQQLTGALLKIGFGPMIKFAANLAAFCVSIYILGLIFGSALWIIILALATFNP